MVSAIWSKLFWGFAALGALWAVLLSSLTHPFLQRHALYAHKLHSAWWQNLNEPEKWGFLKNQIRPFNISTPDGCTLYAWHILPLTEYQIYEQELLDEPSDVDYYKSIAYKALKKQPASRVVINFHGNAGHIGQGWRTDGYRALSVGQPHTHVIAFDYRGFGYSTCTPTESGLITDGIAATNWVLRDLQVPPKSVALVGQSLGTAVATAVAEQLAVERGVELAGIVLVAPFSDLKTLLLNYAIGGFVPILSPLRPYPKIQTFFEEKIVDTWHTDGRLANFVRSSKFSNLILIHAKDDFDIHWSHSSTLFYVAANATSEDGLTAGQVIAMTTSKDLGRQGIEFSWTTATGSGPARRITHNQLKHGGHNRVLTYPAVSKAVLEIFAEQL